MARVALGISYNGSNYQGWQSQLSGQTIQDKLESALARFSGLADTAPLDSANSGTSTTAGEPGHRIARVTTLCAGRTDAGVHGLMQVVHFDTPLVRDMSAWVRGPNTHLPSDIAVQWAHAVPGSFHCRGSAISRRYAYIVLQSQVRPSVDAGRVGWVYKPLNLALMQHAASRLVGQHDFSSFRASSCQALSPVKTMLQILIQPRGAYWRFEFEANAFLHHMIRNIMGCLIAIGQGKYPPHWIDEVLVAKNRDAAAPTFSPDGLYFLGPRYEAHWGLPERTAAFDLLP